MGKIILRLGENCVGCPKQTYQDLYICDAYQLDWENNLLQEKVPLLLKARSEQFLGGYCKHREPKISKLH